MRHPIIFTLILGCVVLTMVGCGEDDPVAPGQEGVLRVPSRYRTIQSAIDAAEPGDVVLVAPGTYSDKVEIEYWPGFNMTVTVNMKSGVEVRGDSDQAGDVVLVGNPDQPVVTCVEVDNTATLSNLTVTGGRAGIMGWHADVNVTNCVIRDIINGSPNGAGAGLYFDFGAPTLTNCNITGNMATAGGGAVFANECQPTLTNCVFFGNAALTSPNEPGKGGALVLGNDTIGLLTNCLFSANQADSLGGAIHIYNSRIEMVNCNLTNNRAGGLGGAFLVSYHAEVLMTNCVVENNQAELEGGGFYFRSDTSLEATYSSILNNTAPQGSDGFIRGPYQLAVVNLHCSQADPDQWTEPITLDNENCD